MGKISTTLTPQHFIRTIFLGFIFLSIFCRGQTKPAIANNSAGLQNAKPGGVPKVAKNHFFQWPNSYLFIQCGLQDKKGTMWFGSSGDGVYSYNGKLFTNYTSEHGLGNNDVLCMLEDRNGNIWFGTRGGLCRHKPSEGKAFVHFPVSATSKHASDKLNSKYGNGLTTNFVWSIMQDKTGRIWLGTNEGVYYFDPNDDVPLFMPFLDNPAITNKNRLHLKLVQKIIQDKKGIIWFASGDKDGEGICCYDGKTLVNFKPDNVASFRSIVESRNGDLVFLSNTQGAYRYDGKNFSVFSEVAALKNRIITAAMEDKHGNFWLGTDNHDNNVGKDDTPGVVRYDGRSFKLYSKKDGLSNNSVFCIVEDRDGNIWFGTRNTGLCRYDGKTFTDYTEQ